MLVCLACLHAGHVTLAGICLLYVCFISGAQKMDGLVGSLVIRQPSPEEPHRDMYDKDIPSHTVIVQDWQHEPSDQIMPAFSQTVFDQGPASYLINGRGFGNLVRLWN